MWLCTQCFLHVEKVTVLVYIKPTSIYLSAFIPHNVADYRLYWHKCSSPGNSKSVVTNCCMLLLILNIESVNFWQNIYWKKPCISSHDTALQLKFSILTSLVHFKFYVVIKMTCLSTNWHTYCKLTVYYSCSNMQDRLTQIIILLSIMICMMIWSIIIIYFEEWSY